jgi:signal transduction histidine kinase
MVVDDQQFDKFSRAAIDIRRMLSWMVAGISVFVAFVVPAFILTIEVSEEEARAKQVIENLADNLSIHVAKNQETWDLQEDRLRDIVASFSPYTESRCHTRLLLNDGGMVLEHGISQSSPFLSVDAEVSDGKEVVAQISFDVGLWNAILHSVIASLMGVIVAAACFLILRFFPFRFVDDALSLIVASQKELKSQFVMVSQARQEADAANRAKSEFLANVSHELKTPLNHIIGYSDMWSGGYREFNEEALMADLKIIGISGKHLLNIVNDILDIAKVESGRFALDISEFEIKEITEELALTLRAEAEKNENMLEIACPGDIGTMHSDPTRIKQIVLNLLSNAIKFTKGGKITVQASREVTDAGDYVTVQVVDTGIGMDTQAQKKVFEPFAQADNSTTRKFGGTGLGLTICSRLAELLGGKITVWSEPETGSVFTVVLPANIE